MVDVKSFLTRWYQTASSHHPVWGHEIKELKRMFPHFVISRRPNENLQQQYYRIYEEIKHTQQAAYDQLRDQCGEVAEHLKEEIEGHFHSKRDEFSRASIVKRRDILHELRTKIRKGPQSPTHWV